MALNTYHYLLERALETELLFNHQSRLKISFHLS